MNFSYNQCNLLIEGGRNLTSVFEKNVSSLVPELYVGGMGSILQFLITPTTYPLKALLKSQVKHIAFGVKRNS